MELVRYLFEIAYKGTNYHGWQRQKNALSVQQVVEESLATIMRKEITIVGSGRTDAGVHCSQQFFHTDFTKLVQAGQLVFKLNSLLPSDITIQSAKVIHPDAHARFDATKRAYEYRILTKRSPFYTELSCFLSKLPDTKTMNAAASLLVGKQDFEAFSKVKTEVNNFTCEVFEAQWVESEGALTFHISANRFLRGMVRAVVGTLLDVGYGKTSIEEVHEIIASKNRRTAGSAAPARGLFLTKVAYPDSIFIK